MTTETQTAETTAPAAVTFTLRRDQIETIMNNVAPFVATYDTSSILGGVFLQLRRGGGLSAVATDGSRMAAYDLTDGTDALADDISMIIPASVFADLAKVWRKKTAGDVGIEIDYAQRSTLWNGQQRTHIHAGDIRIGGTGSAGSAKITPVTGRLVNGEYPRYQELFPVKHSHRITMLPVKVRDWEKPSEVTQTGYALGDHALRIKQLHRQEPTTGIKLTFNGADAVKVSCKGSKFWSYDATEDKIDHEGNNLEICFSAHYLAEVLETMSGAVTMTTEGPLKPCVFTSLGVPNVRHLLMPIQLKDRR